MKKGIALLCMIAMLFSLAACSGDTGSSDSAALPNGATAEGEAIRPQAGSIPVRVIKGAGTGSLVLAGKTRGDVYTVSETELTVYLDEQPAKPSDLENGMLLMLDPGFFELETWPGGLIGATVHAYSKPADKDDHGDLCGLYLQVLEDLWTDDSGLNSDISYFSVDLDDAPGALTDGEKTAIAWIFSGAHDKQGLEFSFEELTEKGYVDKGELYWEDGVLFSIKTTENGKNSAQEITFDAQKWRSGTGAIFYMGCTAQRGTGVQWNPYKAGTFAIS